MVFYFGTTSKNLEEIKVQGLDNPCLTDNIDLAHYYSQEMTEKHGGVEVVFQIKVLDKNYTYKENKKFKYKGKIKPCNIKMIEGPEFPQEISSDEILSLISKHHTHTEDLLSQKYNEIYSFSKFELVELNLDNISKQRNVDKSLILDYLDLNLDECPPIVGVYRNDDLFIIDGIHRVETFRKAKKTTILAYVPKKDNI